MEQQPADIKTLHDLYLQCRDKVYADLEAKKALPASVSPKGSLPDCLRYIIELKPKTENSTFNKLCMNLILGFQKSGYSLPAALEIASHFFKIMRAVRAIPHRIPGSNILQSNGIIFDLRPNMNSSAATFSGSNFLRVLLSAEDALGIQ